MTDAYPLASSPYQPKSPDERAIIMNTSTDPVTTVMNELNAILLDQRVQLQLSQGLVPTSLMLPWVQDLYLRGKADGAVADEPVLRSLRND